MPEEKILVTDLINEVSNQALTLLTSEELIHWVLEKAPLAIDHDAAALIIFDEDRPTCYLRIAQRVDEDYLKDFQGKAIEGFAFETQSGVSKDDFRLVSWPAAEISGQTPLVTAGLASFYCTPLKARDKVIGVCAISSTKPDYFMVYKLNMFNVFAGQVALAIDSLSARDQVVKQSRIIERDSINMKNAFGGMSEGLIMTDEQDKILLVNPTAARMLGLEEVQTERALLECKEKFLAPLLKELAAADKRIVSKEREVEKPYPMTLRFDATIAQDNFARKIGVVVLVRDITREKEIDRMKTEFISIVSHELRTPLTTIRESVSQVLDGILGPTTDEQKEFLSICLEDIDRLTRIINDLLDISKIEAKKAELKKSVVDIVSLVRSVNLFFYPRAREKGLDLETAAPEEAIELFIDRDKIIQVFNNLIGNALKFTAQGHIELAIRDLPDMVECSVSDTGRGIAAEDLPKVFSRFEQFGRTDGPGEKGTGLGLAIAKGIAELHRGTMWVESKLNEGTTFKFTLPKYGASKAIDDAIDRKAADARREGKEFSVVSVKVENFTQIKERFGEKKAYALLIRAAAAVKKAVKGQDFFTHDGHIMVITELDKEAARQTAQGLSASLTEAPVVIDKESVTMQCSVESEHYPEDSNTVKNAG